MSRKTGKNACRISIAVAGTGDIAIGWRTTSSWGAKAQEARTRPASSCIAALPNALSGLRFQLADYVEVASATRRRPASSKQAADSGEQEGSPDSISASTKTIEDQVMQLIRS